MQNSVAVKLEQIQKAEKSARLYSDMQEIINNIDELLHNNKGLTKQSVVQLVCAKNRLQTKMKKIFDNSQLIVDAYINKIESLYNELDNAVTVSECYAVLAKVYIDYNWLSVSDVDPENQDIFLSVLEGLEKEVLYKRNDIASKQGINLRTETSLMQICKKQKDDYKFFISLYKNNLKEFKLVDNANDLFALRNKILHCYMTDICLSCLPIANKEELINIYFDLIDKIDDRLFMLNQDISKDTLYNVSNLNNFYDLSVRLTYANDDEIGEIKQIINNCAMVLGKNKFFKTLSSCNSRNINNLKQLICQDDPDLEMRPK